MKLHHSFLILLLFPFFISFSQNQTVGALTNDATSFNGYTLFSPSKNNIVYLIDNCGEIVKSWTTPESQNLSVHLYDNGNLLFTARDNSTSIFNVGGKGGILILYDWDGNQIWSYNYSAAGNYHHHHDIEPLPNGNLLLIVWEQFTTSEIIAKGKTAVGSNIWIDKIVEIELLGNNAVNEVWEWRAYDHLVQDVNTNLSNYGTISANPQMLDINYYNSTSPDWLHMNAISYNEEEDLIAFSSSVFNEIYIIDHSTTTAEAAGSSGGNFGKGGDILYRWGNPRTYDRGSVSDQKLWVQHNVQWVADSLAYPGALLIFNNGNGRPGGNYSSIDFITPPRDGNGNYILNGSNAYGPNNLTATFHYPNNPFGMYTQFSGGAQLLANGNVLACPSRAHYLIELMPNTNAIAWQYKTPVGDSGNTIQGNPQDTNASAWRAERISPFHPALVGKDLTPQGTIELNPNNIDIGCQIYENENCDAGNLDLSFSNNVCAQEVFEMNLNFANYNIPCDGAWKTKYELFYDAYGNGNVFTTLNSIILEEAQATFSAQGFFIDQSGYLAPIGTTLPSGNYFIEASLICVDNSEQIQENCVAGDKATVFFENACAACTPNLILEGNLQNGKYVASNSIECNGNIESNKNIEFTAENYIELKTGFTLEGEFDATIEPCN